MSAIFISYRREDAEGHAGRLFQVLVEQFGKDSVFMDVAGIEPGRDYRKAIESKVADCGVLLAVIGKGWLAAKDESGQRRIDNPNDFVRLETISALKRDIPVIPVLVNRAAMPRADQLPPEMAELAFRNGVELTHARWDSDVQVLTRALEGHVKKPAAGDPAGLDPVTTAGHRPDQKSEAAPRTLDAASEPRRWPAMKAIGIALGAAALAWGGVAGYQRYAEEQERNADAERIAAAAKSEADKQAAAQKEQAARDASKREAELRAKEEEIKQQAQDAARPRTQLSNLALNKRSRQSSISFGGDPQRAVDGNTDGNHLAKSVSHTNKETEAWWEVDLGQEQEIQAVRIWNRTDCCAERLANFYVLVSERPFKAGRLNAVLDDLSVTRIHYPGVAARSSTIPVKASGRYVRVQLRGANYLSLAEVQVLGTR